MSETNVYETESGLRITLKAVRPVLVQQALIVLEQEWRKRGEPIDPPTYTVKTVADETETFPLTEKNLDDPRDPERTARNHAMWERYQDALKRLEEAKGERQQVIMLALGTDFEMPTDDGWKLAQEWAGVAVPEKPLDLKVHWLLTEALTSYDLAMINAQLQMLNAGRMVSPDQVEQFRATVQCTMEERGRDAFASIIQSFRQLVDERTLPGDDGSAEVGTGDVAVRVG